MIMICLLVVAEMEEKIVAVEEYVKFCALNYEFDAVNPICVRHDSPVNYFDTGKNSVTISQA